MAPCRPTPYDRAAARLCFPSPVPLTIISCLEGLDPVCVAYQAVSAKGSAMLRVLGAQPPLRHARRCDGLSRREMLRAGGLGALGLSLPGLWQGQAAAAEASRPSPAPASSGRGRAKSCIILFL